MMRHIRLEHRFVEHIPDTIEPGVLYITMEYGTAAHSCCCGCGEEVVTPFTPTDWKMTFDGETVSIHPSIGSWSLACRSHYVIRNNCAIEAEPWTDEQIVAERRRDQAAKSRHYGNSRPVDTRSRPGVLAAAPPQIDGFWGRLWRRVVGDRFV